MDFKFLNLANFPFSLIGLPQRLWHTQLLNWRRLNSAPSRNARVLIYFSLFVLVPLSMTDPFKSLYLSRLGLSNLQIGSIYGMDQALRVGGILLGGFLAMRLGYKRTLLVFDFISWFFPSLMLAFATDAWQVTLAFCFFSVNSLVQSAFQCILVQDIPERRLPRTYALQNLVFILPGAVLPLGVTWMLAYWDLVPAMRVLYLIQAVLSALGCWIRYRLLRDTPPQGQAGWNPLEMVKEIKAAGQAMLETQGLKLIILLWVLVQVGNVGWGGFFGPYAVQVLGFREGALGIFAQVGAAFFVIAAVVLVPRVRERELKAAFFFAFVLGVFSKLMLFSETGMRSMLMLSMTGGFAGALSSVLLLGFLASSLPAAQRSWCFAITFSLQQAAQALALPLMGGLFTVSFAAFPWIHLGLALAQAVLAYWIWRRG